MKIKSLLFVILTIFITTACSSDKSNDPSPVSPIVGTWNAKEIFGFAEGTSLDEETRAAIIKRRDPAFGSNGDIFITFNADGTGYKKEAKSEITVQFTYTFINNNLTLTAVGELPPNMDEVNRVTSNYVEVNALEMKLWNYENDETLKEYQELFPNAGLTKFGTILVYSKIR